MMTDAGRANVWWAAYEPYGQVHATGGTLTQNLQLPGQWFQLETGLAYNWHRHYDPTLGRYTTPDPLGFVDGPSVFAYAGGAPQRKTDRKGLWVSAPNMTPRPPSIVSQCLGGDISGDDSNCTARRYREILICQKEAPVARGARSRCYESVEKRFFACNNGMPMPPLIRW